MELYCNKCQQHKTPQHFNIDNSRKIGYTRWCRDCFRTYRLEHKVERRLLHEKYYSRPEIKEARRIYKRDYMADPEHRAMARAAEKERLKDPDIKQRTIMSKIKYRSNPVNKQKESETKKTYCARPEIKERINRWKRQKYKGNLNYRLITMLRNRLRLALKRKKPDAFTKNLGCSIDDLIRHLESRFQKGMTWNNWGPTGWHIDHIKPLSKFDLSDLEEFRQAVHYTNLQPLWAKDNLSKNNRILQ